MKTHAKRLLRKLGIEAHSYSPGASPAAQLAAAIAHFGIDTVLDIGANAGQFVQELRAGGFGGRVFSVEPLPSAHEALRRAATTDPSWHVHPPSAVGAAAGQVEFHVAQNLASSSVLTVRKDSVSAAPESRQVETITVPLTTVDALVQQYGLSSRGAMLKVDTQGYEWQVLDGAVHSLALFDLVLLELSLVELYTGQRLWRDMMDRMSGAGFGLWLLQSEFVDPSSGRTLQMNGLFHRLPDGRTGP